MDSQHAKTPSATPSTSSTANVTRKAFVLLSGGLDSTTCLYKAAIDYGAEVGKPKEIIRRMWLNRTSPEDFDPIPWVEAISIDYGQRHSKEMEYAAKTCDSLGIKHTMISLGNILGRSMLTDPTIEVPNISYSDIKSVSPTYVPNRNMTMLAVLTAQAQLWVNAEREKRSSQGLITTPEDVQAGVYAGMHAEDAQNWAYPDCTPEFIGAMANAIHVATYFHVRLHTPLQWMMKSDIVTLGDTLAVDFRDTWSCYKGERLHCGVCPTCRSRREAFICANVVDPTDYAN